jgi:hypothetical protein
MFHTQYMYIYAAISLNVYTTTNLTNIHEIYTHQQITFIIHAMELVKSWSYDLIWVTGMNIKETKYGTNCILIYSNSVKQKAYTSVTALTHWGNSVIEL